MGCIPSHKSRLAQKIVTFIPSLESCLFRQKLETGMKHDSCRICGSSRFHPSHFRQKDLWQLLALRLPARCMNCNERTFLSFLQMLKLRNARKVRRQEISPVVLGEKT
jgi:hypothetical protein